MIKLTNQKDFNIAIQIKHYRNEKKIKQKDLADFLGIKLSTYANYENNHRAIPSAYLKDIATYLGVDLNDLLGSTFDKEGASIPQQGFIIVPTQINEYKFSKQKSITPLYTYLTSEGFDVSLCKEEDENRIEIKDDDNNTVTFNNKEFNEFNRSIVEYIKYELYKKASK